MIKMIEQKSKEKPKKGAKDDAPVKKAKKSGEDDLLEQLRASLAAIKN